MITLDYQNLFKVNALHGLDQKIFDVPASKIQDLLKKIESRGQGFYKILDDSETLLKINDYANTVKGKYKHMVVLGIGGSTLGITTLQKSLTHEFKNNIYILDNIDPDYMREVEDVIDLKETLFIVISKSGGTVETLSQYFYFRKKIEALNLEQKNHFVFVTDPAKGLLREIANTEGVKSFKIPENVGGRFSVLTPVGMLPAKLIGLQINDLIEGAKLARDNFYNPDASVNIAWQLAKIQFEMYQKGKFLNIMMPYSSKLKTFTEWYAQLLAESIGKDGIGITPVSAHGVTDQHSQNQLYHDGPNDKLIIFIELENFKTKLEIPNLYPEHAAVDYLRDTTFNELMCLEKLGTETSLTERDRPNITIKLPNLTEKSLGEFFFILESSIAFLGEMFKVNAYDQPGVELSKQLTKQYYERKA